MTTQKFTFPKHYRLLTSYQFRKVTKYGKGLSGKYLSIQLHSSRHSTCKLGLTVSRKFGKAIRRNRFKRLVREAFRLSQHQLPSNIHINIRPSQFNENVSMRDIQDEMLSLIEHGVKQIGHRNPNTHLLALSP